MIEVRVVIVRLAGVLESLKGKTACNLGRGPESRHVLGKAAYT